MLDVTLPPLPEPAGYVSDFRDGAVFALKNPNDCGIAVHSAVDLEAFAREAVMADRRLTIERCAQIVYDSTDYMHDERDFVIKEIIAAAIRCIGE